MVPQCVTSTFKPAGGAGQGQGGGGEEVRVVTKKKKKKERKEEYLMLILTFDFFGEFHPVRVGEWAGLLVNVVNVQNLTHELDDGLSFVEGCG